MTKTPRPVTCFISKLIHQQIYKWRKGAIKNDNINTISCIWFAKKPNSFRNHNRKIVLNLLDNSSITVFASCLFCKSIRLVIFFYVKLFVKFYNDTGVLNCIIHVQIESRLFLLLLLKKRFYHNILWCVNEQCDKTRRVQIVVSKTFINDELGMVGYFIFFKDTIFPPSHPLRPNIVAPDI